MIIICSVRSEHGRYTDFIKLDNHVNLLSFDRVMFLRFSRSSSRTDFPAAEWENRVETDQLRINCIMSECVLKSPTVICCARLYYSI